MAQDRQIEIRHLWNGEEARPDERVGLSLSVVGSRLVIEVDAPLHADVPAPSHPPGPTPRLWEHEVVELFVADGGDRYLEVELGPFGHHLVLRLDGVRNVVAERLPLAYSTSRAIGGDVARWSGSASLPLSLLPVEPARFNAFAVHGEGSGRRFLAHEPTRGPEPDFHRLEAFVPWPF